MYVSIPKSVQKKKENLKSPQIWRICDDIFFCLFSVLFRTLSFPIDVAIDLLTAHIYRHLIEIITIEQ